MVSIRDKFKSDNGTYNVFILLIAGILLTFGLAIFTGTLFRWSFIGNIPRLLEPENIRHAHSHLMFFGWVTLLPFLLLSYDLKNHSLKSTSLLYSITGWLFWLGLATWPAFLLYGYQPIQIGTLSLPISVILSGIVMILWYVFIIFYWYSARSVITNFKSIYTDTAIILLLISSLGAWAVAVIQFLFPDLALLAKASTHFFLTTFTEGWCMLFGLGVLKSLLFNYSLKKPYSSKIEYTGIVLISLGSLFLFPYAMGREFMTPLWIWIVRLATIASFIGYVLIGTAWKNLIGNLRLTEKLPLFFLLLKVIILFTALFIPAELWLGRHQINIFYLHNSLLGFVTLSLIAYMRRQLSKIISESWPYYLLYLTVFLVWLSLIPMMPGFPVWAHGTWIYILAAYVSPWPGVMSIILAVFIVIRYSLIVPNTK